MFGATDGDVVSFDTYSWSDAVYGRMNLFREAGLEQNRPYWCYLNRCYSDAYPTESDMRWNVFAHATFGFTGYSWFIYQIEPGHGLMPALFAAAGDYAAAKTTAVRSFDEQTGTVVDTPLSGVELTVTLPAGDAVLFKYDTGKPFAMQ